jgi:hypothetical protein
LFCRLTNSSLLVALALAAPGLVLPAALSLNGTCELNTCSPVDTLNVGQSTSGAVNFVYTFANGDRYQVSGDYSTGNDAVNGTSISFNPAVFYLGTAASSTAPSQADTLTLDFLQNYNFPGSLDGYYFESTTSSVSGPIASDSTYTAQLFYDGQGLGVMGPYGPGINTGFNQQNLTGLTNPLMADFNFVYSFGAGSDPGSGIASISAVPEPASLLLLLTGGVVVASRTLFVRKRKLQGPVQVL